MVQRLTNVSQTFRVSFDLSDRKLDGDRLKMNAGITVVNLAIARSLIVADSPLVLQVDSKGSLVLVRHLLKIRGW